MWRTYDSCEPALANACSASEREDQIGDAPPVSPCRTTITGVSSVVEGVSGVKSNPLFHAW